MYFLYTWCRRELCNRFGRTPNCRDSWNNHISQYISYACQLNNTPKPRRPGVRCTTSALVCTSCTRGVQENGAISLVVLQTAEILGLITCFAIYFYALQLYNTPKSRRPGVSCTTSTLVCTSCTRGVQENGAIRFGRTPNCRDSRINHMFRNTFPMRDNLIIPLTLGDQG